MLFVESHFIFIFLPIVIALFYLAGTLSGKYAALTVICLSSVVFYFPNSIAGDNPNISHLVLATSLLLASVAINFAIACYLTDEGTKSHTTARKAVFTIGMTLNFGALALFKYTNEFLKLAEGTNYAPLIAIGIPAGISFYTFHQAVVLSDCYNRKSETLEVFKRSASDDVISRLKAYLRSAISYGAFILLFPQLVIGPISYLAEIAPQYLKRSFGKLRRIDIAIGTTLFAIGFFKKVVIADYLGGIADSGFSTAAAGGTMAAARAWQAALAYYGQLYFDFSGYSDMAVGIARLFGLRFPNNFDSPLRAVGIADFYQRWHMTLTRVIAKFLFTPLSLWGTRFAADRVLSGWKRKTVALWIPLWLNFFVIALWHGATSTFFLFGLVHGSWYILETEIKGAKLWRRYKRATSERQRQIFGQFIATIGLILTFALFRSSDLPSFARLLTSMIGRGEDGVALPISSLDWAVIAASFAIVWLLPNAYELLGRYRPNIKTFTNVTMTPWWFRFEWRPTPCWGLFVAVLLAIAFVKLGTKIPFLYGQF